MKVTLSVIKADIGGWVGHSDSHPEILELARQHLEKAKAEGMLIDFHVTKCGDDAQLIINECERQGLLEEVADELCRQSEVLTPNRPGPWIAFSLILTPKQKTMAVLAVVEQLKRKDGD